IRTSARTTTSASATPAARSPTTSASSDPSASKSPSAASPNPTQTEQPRPSPPDPYRPPQALTSPDGQGPLPHAQLISFFRVRCLPLGLGDIAIVITCARLR